MSQHPDDLDKSPASYDPSEPLIVTYADVIAACNAVGALLLIVKDTVDPLSEFRQENIKHGLATAVAPNLDHLAFASLDDAASWLLALRNRLTGCLPLASGNAPTR